MHALLVLASFAVDSRAAEVQFEGFYRARFRAFDTLSLDRTNPLSEGLAAYAQHRLWLKPRFLLTDDVSMAIEIRGLDGVTWGDEPGAYDAFVDPPPNLIEYDLNAPTSDTDPSATLLDLTLWRAYGQVDTPIGMFTFGRIPLHWGSGIWLNDGVTSSSFSDWMSADHGDTTDAVQWERLFEDQFYLRASVEVPVERFVGENDDTTAFGLGAAYKSETMTAGVLLQLDHTGQRDTLGSLNVFTADVAASTVLGKLDGAAEIVGQFGGGDLDNGINDASITAIGAVVEAGLDLEPWRLQVQGGLATGDGRTDLNLRTFSFDRDYSVGMFMFEQPMPVLSTTDAAANDTNGGRDFSETLTGTALSNALFIKPRISREIVDGFTLDASWLGARVAKTAPVNGITQNRGYGHEFQLGASYTGIRHFAVDARGGLFLPGSVYSVSQDVQTPSGFDDPVFGFQLSGRIAF